MDKRKQETLTTLLPKEAAPAQREWYVFDAAGKTLGRFCSEVAKILRGKHKVTFTPNVDLGDGVIIINAEKIRVTGAKAAQKTYLRYTGHIGGQRETTFSHMRDSKPEYILRHAIAGMMPKSRLGKQQLRKLRIFKGDQHPLQAQQPVKVDM